MERVKVFWYVKLLCPQKTFPCQDAVESHPVGTVRLGSGEGGRVFPAGPTSADRTPSSGRCSTLAKASK